jgi:hypothetical protein
MLLVCVLRGARFEGIQSYQLEEIGAQDVDAERVNRFRTWMPSRLNSGVQVNAHVYEGTIVKRDTSPPPSKEWGVSPPFGSCPDNSSGQVLPIRLRSALVTRVSIIGLACRSRVIWLTRARYYSRSTRASSVPTPRARPGTPPGGKRSVTMSLPVSHFLVRNVNPGERMKKWVPKFPRVPT